VHKINFLTLQDVSNGNVTVHDVSFLTCIMIHFVASTTSFGEIRTG